MRFHAWMMTLMLAASCSSFSPYVADGTPIKPGDGVDETDVSLTNTDAQEDSDTDVIWETSTEDDTDSQGSVDSDPPVDTQPQGPVCGNNTIETGEVCDGALLNGQTCMSQGFDGGTLSCGFGCTSFDTSACTTDPVSTFRPELCEDTCPGGSTNWLNDGACDDGGPNSDFSVCPYGSDCTDCGTRTNTTPGCNNTCPFAFDGTCDDGGTGAAYNDCLLGDDCYDCGAR